MTFTPLVWGVTIAIIIALLAVDLILAALKPHRVGFKEATAWSVFYIGIALILFARHGRNVPIPFGPYLAAAGVIALFWGETLTTRYLGLL